MNTDIAEVVRETVTELGTRFAEFKDEHQRALAAEIQYREDFERKFNLARFDARTSPTEPPAATWMDAKTKQAIPVLSHKHRLADLTEQKPDTPSMGRILRGVLLGNRADDARELAEERKALGIVSDASGGILAPDYVAGRWIDALRARMVLSQAGARTIPMPGKTLTLAAITADPTIAWHAENSAITPSDPTFTGVTLSAKTITAVCKVSVELAADAANIEQVIESTLIAKTATEIDSAGLNGTAVNAALAPSGVFNLTGRNTVTGVGAPTNWDWCLDAIGKLLAANVPLENIGTLIGAPSLWLKMAKLKTGLSGDQTPLRMPEAVEKLPTAWTTAAPSGKAIIADWRDLLFGVRKDLTVRVLNEAFLGSNLQVAFVVYARVDFAAARPASFVTAEGITVS